MRIPAPDAQQARELQNLANGKVEEYLRKVLDNVKTNLITQREESVVRTLQGQGQLLNDLLGLIDPTKNPPTSGKR